MEMDNLISIQELHSIVGTGKVLLFAVVPVTGAKQRRAQNKGEATQEQGKLPFNKPSKNNESPKFKRLKKDFIKYVKELKEANGGIVTSSTILKARAKGGKYDLNDCYKFFDSMDEVRKAAGAYKTIPQMEILLSIKQRYKDFGKRPTRRDFSPDLIEDIENIFGTFTKALKAAGIR